MANILRFIWNIHFRQFKIYRFLSFSILYSLYVSIRYFFLLLLLLLMLLLLLLIFLLICTFLILNVFKTNLCWNEIHSEREKRFGYIGAILCIGKVKNKYVRFCQQNKKGQKSRKSLNNNGNNKIASAWATAP